MSLPWTEVLAGAATTLAGASSTLVKFMSRRLTDLSRQLAALEVRLKALEDKRPETPTFPDLSDLRDRLTQIEQRTGSIEERVRESVALDDYRSDMAEHGRKMDRLLEGLGRLRGMMNGVTR